MSIYNQIIKNTIPKHIAIIMDGNGRWALEKGKNRFAGHVQGVKSVNRIVKEAIKLKFMSSTVQHLTGIIYRCVKNYPEA